MKLTYKWQGSFGYLKWTIFATTAQGIGKLPEGGSFDELPM
jgi:hypothetical protein